MKYFLELEIPELPLSLNVVLRMHFHKRHQYYSRWYLMIQNLVQDRIPPTPLAKCTITFSRFSYRMLDYDGVVGSGKPLVDSLIRSAVIMDDSYSVTGPWKVTQEFRSKKLGPLIYLSVSGDV